MKMAQISIRIFLAVVSILLPVKSCPVLYEMSNIYWVISKKSDFEIDLSSIDTFQVTVEMYIFKVTVILVI
jgi:hypothetical protein